MFLTPEHFLRQETYFDSLLLWLVRYTMREYGLLGSGPRVEASERGAARFDPIVQVDESEEELKITLTQCRGVTPGGALVDVDPSSPVRGTFKKKQLEGTKEVGIYVVARPHQKEPDEDSEDALNPEIRPARRRSYGLTLEVQPDQTDWSLLLTRLRRAEAGIRFEKVSGFIPPCVFMTSHSELMHSHRQLNEIISGTAERYTNLHRAIVDFIAVAQSRGLGIEQDQETLEFVSRMVLALEECAYAAIDPLQAPSRFFQHVTRLIRSSALFLSLSPPTREYFRLLGEIGETEFVSLLEQEGSALQIGREWSPHDNLRPELEKMLNAIERLVRLEHALEGKYLDFRVSPSLEGINFVFDRTTGEPVLYRTVAKPARPQAQGQELTFVFAPLRLEAREVYRLILVGDRHAKFFSGDRLSVELRVNPGEGYSRKPQYLTSQHEIEGHRNFAIDFKAPEDVVSISDVRVSLRSGQPIRSAILYVRSRLMPGRAKMAAEPRMAVEPRIAPEPARFTPEPRLAPEPRRPVAEPEAPPPVLDYGPPPDPAVPDQTGKARRRLS